MVFKPQPAVGYKCGLATDNENVPSDKRWVGGNLRVEATLQRVLKSLGDKQDRKFAISKTQRPEYWPTAITRHRNVMFERFSETSRRCVILAQEAASELGAEWLTDEHLLLGVLREGTSLAAQVLDGEGASASAVAAMVVAMPATGKRPAFSPEGKRCLEYALREALVSGSASIEPSHILLGILRVNGPAAGLLLGLGVDPESLRDQLGGEPAQPVEETAGGNQRRGRRGAKKSMLEEFGRNLTQAALNGELDPVLGRDKEVTRVLEILCRRTKSNPVLIGEPGVGKTAVAEAVAQEIVRDGAPSELRDIVIWEIDMGSMVAGTRYRGDFEERIKGIIKEASSRDVVLFIDEVHATLGAGASSAGGVGAGDLLKPAMARGALRIIGATTEDEYRIIEKDKALERRFMPVRIAEPDLLTTKRILRKIEPRFGEYHGLVATDTALDAAVELTARHLPERNFPDKAIDALDEAMAGVVMRLPREHAEARREAAALRRNGEADLVKEGELAAAGVPVVLEKMDIVNAVSAMAGVVIDIEDQREKLLTLEQSLGERLIGQRDAIATVSRAVRRMRAGLADTRRIGGAFLFVGPTGVGKTELARVVADELFDNHLVQIDMSEYMEAHSVSRLIGAPPGYVGHDEAGQLTEAVRRRPECVVLLDEIEKAHPDVLNLLLQLFEEGRLTDAQGRKVDFTRAIVVMTSNLGVGELSRTQVGFNTSGGESVSAGRVLHKAVKDALRPELIGRIDEIVVFQPLSVVEVAAIAELMLSDVRSRLVPQNIGLAWTNDAVGVLVRAGYDPELGARPLRRAVGSLVENALSECMLNGTIRAGQTALLVLRDGAIVIDVADPDELIENLAEAEVG